MEIHAQLLASAISAGAPMQTAVADLRAIVSRCDEQLRRARRARDVPRIALLEERRRRCERAIGEILSSEG